jgi:hypothetical protein
VTWEKDWVKHVLDRREKKKIIRCLAGVLTKNQSDKYMGADREREKD